MSTPTRSSTKHPIIGFASTLASNVLPSETNVLKYLLYLKMDQKQSGKKDKYMIYAQACDEIVRIWKIFSLPTITTAGIIYRIKNLDTKINEHMKSWSRKKDDEKSKITNDFEKMFDVSPCTCYDKGISRKDCPCAIKIPLSEWKGYIQQKQRIGVIGPIDREGTRKLQDRIKERQLQARKSETLLPCHTAETAKRHIPGREIEGISQESSTEGHNTYRYPNVSLLADRYNLSDKAVAAICNGLLKDMGLLNDRNKLDRKKISRERHRHRKEAINVLDESAQNLVCIGFDGRKDRTKTISTLISEEGSTQKNIIKEVTEEHISITMEPSGTYMDHVTPKSEKQRI